MIVGPGNPQMTYVKVVDGAEIHNVNGDVVSIYPASLTKLMTLKLMRLYKSGVWTSETVTVTTADVTAPVGGLTTAGLEAGDVLTWEQLAYALLLPSGFDAALCAARIIGDIIYTQNGSTGNSGVTRFVEQMNNTRADLGMVHSFYTDPYGNSGAGHNYATAHDIATLAENILGGDGVAQGIAGTASFTFSIAGSNPRSIAWNNVATIVKCDDIAAAKTGIWSGYSWNMVAMWSAPSGDLVVVVTLGSISTQASLLDTKGIIYGLVVDASDLNYAFPQTDPNFSDVQALVSAFSDDSNEGRLVGAASEVGDGPIISRHDSMTVADQDDEIYVDGDSDLRAGSGDMTVEMWYAGPGFVPSGEVLFALKADGSKEWAVNCYGGGFDIFASSDGSSWTHAFIGWDANDLKVFFNGAPRHIAMVKNGSNWNLWINGEKQNVTISVGTVYAADNKLYLCKPGAACIGRIGDFRVTMGVARYSADVETLVGVNFPRS